MLVYAVLIVCLTGFYVGLMGYYLLGWSRLLLMKPSPHSNTTKLSVILPARNEEASIKNCMEDIIGQDYPADLFELIVVDDHSDDNTFEIANKMAGGRP